MTVQLVALHILALAQHTRVPVHRPNMVLKGAAIPRLPGKIFIAFHAETRLRMVQLRVALAAQKVGKRARASVATVPMGQLRVVKKSGHVWQLEVATRAAPGADGLAHAVDDGGVVAEAFHAGEVKLALATVVGVGQVRVLSELFGTRHLGMK